MERIRKALDLARLERSRPMSSRVEMLRPVEAPRLGEMPKRADTPKSPEISPLADTPKPPETTRPVQILRPETFRTVEIVRPVQILEPAEAFAAAETPERTEAFGFVDALEPTELVEQADTPSSTASVATVSPARIEYSRTKTFSPPRKLLEANRILDPSGGSPAAAAFRMLRTQVLQRMNEHQWRSLAVLSPGSEDGKTTTAINLAVSLANDHRHTVLLVEFDLKKPCIAHLLGIAPETGADDLLRGGADLEDCLYHPEGFDRLVVLPARAALNDSSEVLAGPWCRELVMQLRSRYPDRILVFDLPPVLGADDALAFLPLVECALVVVAEGSTRRDDLVNCMELLRKTPVVGTVLNRASHVATPYGR